MLPRETWRVAVEALWSNKLRAILTTLGVVIGSACIVLVVTVAVTGRRYVIGQIEGVGANLVYVNYEVNPQQAVVRSDEITVADMEPVTNAVPNDGPEDVVLVTSQVGELLRSRHSRTATYVVQNLSAILDAARRIGTALTVVLLVIGFIALMVSGIGIMNIMLVTVTERTREIGIRKAIGARRQEILFQFLIEALLMSGIGSLMGVLIALAIPVMVRPLLPGNLRVPVPWLSVVVAFVVACSTGLFFGYLPADKAARLQPTESLRYE